MLLRFICPLLLLALVLQPNVQADEKAKEISTELEQSIICEIETSELYESRNVRSCVKDCIKKCVDGLLTGCDIFGIIPSLGCPFFCGTYCANEHFYGF